MQSVISNYACHHNSLIICFQANSSARCLLNPCVPILILNCKSMYCLSGAWDFILRPLAPCFHLGPAPASLAPSHPPPPDNWHPVQPPRSYVRCSRTKAKRILKKMPHKQGSFGGLPSESLLLRWGLGLRWQDRASFTWQTVTAAGGAPRSELEQI